MIKSINTQSKLTTQKAKIFSYKNLRTFGIDSIHFGQGKADKMFVFDLDGTFDHGRPKDKQTIFDIKEKNNALLIYATGRDLQSAKDLIEGKTSLIEQQYGLIRDKLPAPDYLISSNGIEIYKMVNGELEEDKDWLKLLTEETKFDPKKISEELKKLAQKTKYEIENFDEKSGDYKGFLKAINPIFYKSNFSCFKESDNEIGIYINPSLAEEFQKDIKNNLAQSGIKVKTIKYYFSNKELRHWPRASQELCTLKCDKKGGINKILICISDKGAATKYIAKKLKIKEKNIITAGNDGNDIPFIQSGLNFICVSNAEDILKDFIAKIKHVNKKIFMAKEWGTKGIIEGLSKFLNAEPE